MTTMLSSSHVLTVVPSQFQGREEEDRKMVSFENKVSNLSRLRMADQRFCSGVGTGIIVAREGFVVGLVRTVVSISHCGCDDPGSIPGLDSVVSFPRGKCAAQSCDVFQFSIAGDRDPK